MRSSLASYAFVLLAGVAVAQDAPRPPNVLFIAVDDLRPELGCYGVAHAQTPNLDRLARSGVVFTRHFAVVPTCGASRYALLTGRSPARSRALGNGAFYQGATALRAESLAGAQTMPELFRRSGYRTVCIGKISHTADGKVYAYDGSGDGRAEMPNAWDVLATPYGPWRRGWGAFFAYAGGKHREDGQGHRDRTEFVAERDEDLPDGLLAQRAIEELARAKEHDVPLFLGVGFFKPHLPWVATRADWDAFEGVDVPPPQHPERPASAYLHASGEFNRYRAPDDATDADARRAYLACVRYVDRQIGKVLAALDDSGLASSTIVVVWGDHGWHLADSGLWGKHTPFERALHSALIVRVPGVGKPGTSCDALVSTLDLYPTLVDLCQPKFTRTQQPLDGRSLRPLLDGSTRVLHEAVLGYQGAATSVRTEDHRLIFKGAGAAPRDVELYDLRDGPDPIENVARQRPQVVAELLRPVTGPASDSGRR